MPSGILFLKVSGIIGKSEFANPLSDCVIIGKSEFANPLSDCGIIGKSEFANPLSDFYLCKMG